MPAPAPEAPDLDPTMLDRLRTLGGADLVRRVVDAFLSEGRGRITRGLDGAAAGDLTRVADAAHSLISSTAQLGATRMADLSREIESLARAGDATGVSARLAEWRVRFDAAEAALRDAREAS